MCGMKIGRNSRIMMKTVVVHPWKIRIGANTIINEHCYLDGRGGLVIGDNSAIALHTMLVTGTHDLASNRFAYHAEPIVVGDGVWIAVRTTILNGCRIKDGAVICAGSVLTPGTVCEELRVMGGVPAREIKGRGVSAPPKQEVWNIHFR